MAVLWEFAGTEAVGTLANLDLHSCAERTGLVVSEELVERIGRPGFMQIFSARYFWSWYRGEQLVSIVVPARLQ